MNADDDRLANLRERAWQSAKGDSPSWGDIDFLIAQVERLTAERDEVNHAIARKRLDAGYTMEMFG